MDAYNFYHLVREIPAATWRAYLASRCVAVPDSFDWSAEEKVFSDALSAVLKTLPPGLQASLHAELRHVHALANPKGMDAIRNAGEDGTVIHEVFARLRNHAERALWVRVHQPSTFIAAEALLQFDLGVGKRSWKRHTINVSAPVSRAEADLNALAGALSEAYSKRRGPKRRCQVDLCDRYLDGGVQVSVYLEEDPNDPVEFVDDGMRRRTTRPATGLALVYYPASGIVDTVGPGGAKVHQPLITLFARHLLQRNVKPEAVRQPLFDLNRLRYGLNLPEDADFDLAAHGVERIRLRRARLRSTRAPLCDFWVGVPADPSAPCALSASRSQLGDHDLFRGPYNLVEALISVSFTPSAAGKRGRVLNIDLNQAGISNLRDLDEADARLAQRLLRAWGVCEPTAVELALVA
jgi:hypothetical protein